MLKVGEVEIFFCFAMSQFDWLITQKNMKLWRLPEIERFYFEVQSSSPLAPPIQEEKGGEIC
jgi:hypothetical protein